MDKGGRRAMSIPGDGAATYEFFRCRGDSSFDKERSNTDPQNISSSVLEWNNTGGEGYANARNPR